MCSNDFICFYDWADCRLIRRIDVNVKVRDARLESSFHVTVVSALPDLLIFVTLTFSRISTGLIAVI